MITWQTCDHEEVWVNEEWAIIWMHKLMKSLLEYETYVEVEISIACKFGFGVLKYNEEACSLPHVCVHDRVWNVARRGWTAAFRSHCYAKSVYTLKPGSVCTSQTPHTTGIFLLLLQIKHMMAFIEQEANEKAEEIEAKVKASWTTVPPPVGFLLGDN